MTLTTDTSITLKMDNSIALPAPGAATSDLMNADPGWQPKPNHPYRLHATRFTRKGCPNDGQDWFVLTRDRVAIAVQSGLFPDAMRDEMAQRCRPSPDPSMGLVQVAESLHELEPVLVALGNTPAGHADLYHTIDLLDARDAVRMAERFLRFGVIGFELQIAGRILSRIQGKEAALLSNRNWVHECLTISDQLGSYALSQYVWENAVVVHEDEDLREGGEERASKRRRLG